MKDESKSDDFAPWLEDGRNLLNALSAHIESGQDAGMFNIKSVPPFSNLLKGQNNER